MIYVKSLVVGAIVFMVTAFLYITIWAYIQTQKYHPPRGVEVGISLGPVLISPGFWLVTFFAFVLGFYSIYRTD